MAEVMRQSEAPEGSMSRRQLLGTGAAALVAGIIGGAGRVEAQSRLRTDFLTFQEARDYARRNGYAIVNTGSNGTVFISAQNLQRIESNPRFRVRTSGTGITYITSVDPTTRAVIPSSMIIGGRYARLDIQEAHPGGDGDQDPTNPGDVGGGDPTNPGEVGDEDGDQDPGDVGDPTNPGSV